MDAVTRKFNVTLADIGTLIAAPGTRIEDVRLLIGDTTSTVTQAGQFDAAGVAICGWKE